MGRPKKKLQQLLSAPTETTGKLRRTTRKIQKRFKDDELQFYLQDRHDDHIHRDPGSLSTSPSGIDSGNGSRDRGLELIEELTRSEVMSIKRAFDQCLEIESVRSQARQQSRMDDGARGGDVETRGHADIGGGFLVEEDALDQTAEGGGDFGGGGLLAEDNTEPDHVAVPAISSPKARGASTRFLGSEQDEGPKRDLLDIEQVPRALEMLNLPFKDSKVLGIFEEAASTVDEAEEMDPSGYEPSDGWVCKAARPKTIQRRKKIDQTRFLKLCGALMIKQRDTGTADEAGFDSAEDEEWPTELEKRFRKRRSTRGGGLSARRTSRGPLSRFRKGHGPGCDDRSSSFEPAAGDDSNEDGETPHLGDSIEADLRTFAMFFDPVPDQPLDRTIGFDEIQEVLQRIGEEMRDEEIQEMLAHASSTRSMEKVVTFEDFRRLLRQLGSVGG